MQPGSDLDRSASELRISITSPRRLAGINILIAAWTMAVSLLELSRRVIQFFA